MMKILIIGGYGAFGGRLAQLLADNSEFSVLIGGRTMTKAEAFCRELGNTEANFTPIKLDKLNLMPTLSRYKPDVVVDASGPFNLKRDNPYNVVDACLMAGIHYLDLADGADFVMGVSDFDSAAKDKGISIISGLSTCPALTGAVLREAQKDMVVESVETGVAPSPFARMGLSVVEGIFDYAGGDITTYENGRPVRVKALTKSRRHTVAPPGAMPLKNRVFALVDGPDLQIFPALNKTIKNTWMGAGTRPGYLLRALMGLSKFRALLRLPRFSLLAKPGHKMLGGLASGEHRGGLYMKLTGGKQTREWHILAEGDDGPFIPSMACAALLTKWANGSVPKLGARPADEELTLQDFEPFFASRKITKGWRGASKNSNYQFEKVLSNNFNELKPLVRALHAPDSVTVWQGEAQVRGPTNILAKLAGTIAGVNVKSGDLPVTVTITPTDKGEIWVRDFGGTKFKSRLIAGTGKNQYLMMEHFGPLAFAMALVSEDDRLYFVPRRWFFLGIPMPQFLLPAGETYETVTNGKFEFNVDLKVPFIGRIASYQGWLEKKEN